MIPNSSATTGVMYGGRKVIEKGELGRGKERKKGENEGAGWSQLSILHKSHKYYYY